MPPKSPIERVVRIAIRRKLVVRFSYRGLERVCEPHVLGITNGTKQVLCWQSAGGSRRGGIPHWRRFDLGGISSFQFTEGTFPGDRPVPFPHSKWDEVLLTV